MLLNNTETINDTCIRQHHVTNAQEPPDSDGDYNAMHDTAECLKAQTCLSFPEGLF